MLVLVGVFLSDVQDDDELAVEEKEEIEESSNECDIGRRCRIADDDADEDGFADSDEFEWFARGLVLLLFESE